MSMMNKKPTQTDQYMARLRRLKVGTSYALGNGDAAYGQRALWRHAAHKLGQTISIKTMPDGVRLYRIL